MTMIKHPHEIALLAEAGRLLATVFERLDRTPLMGMTTLQVDGLVETIIVQDLQARPASKGQYGYGFVLNCSINEVVCHGVPSSTRVLQDGDIVNLDITLEKNGYIADSSKTYLIGTHGQPIGQAFDPGHIPSHVERYSHGSPGCASG